MIDYSSEDIEFIRILANFDSLGIEKEMGPQIKNQLGTKIGVILREYYKENTLGERTGWIEEFEKLGITEDDGKAAIACARRFGLEF